jgi:hypothetical protein
MAWVAAAALCGVAGPASAAVTTGRVFGHAPAGATVQVSNPEFGIQRTTTANAKGRYEATWLPIGVYTATVVDNGQPVVSHPSVQLYVDRGSRVDFGCAHGRCSELAVN